MWLDKVLVQSPLQRICEWQFKNSLTVLTYHAIHHPDRFEEQIKIVKKKMNPVALDEVINAMKHNRTLPKRALLITFDDGHRTVFDVAMPVLKTHELPAVVFVITQHLDTATPFWWEEIKWLVEQGATTREFHNITGEDLVRKLKRLPNEERLAVITELRKTKVESSFSEPQLRWDELPTLESAGIAVGNHTHTHPPLDRVKKDILVDELNTAHNKLISALGHAPQAFAYPYGYANREAPAVLQGLGYPIGFLFDHKIARWPVLNPLAISRVRVDASNRIERFEMIVSGLHPAIHHILGRG